MFSISIPSPCHENWDNMSPREQGSFCAVCAKTVVDFTQLSDEDVRNYFLQHQGQKTCGRFRNDQLAEPRTLHELLSRPIPFWKKFLAITLILFGSFLSGCQNATTGKVKEDRLVTMGVPVPENMITVPAKDLPDTTFKGDVCTMTMGEIIEAPIIETDGIMPIQTVDESKMNPDTTMILVGQTKIDTVKKISVPSPKTDSVTKNSRQSSCDTLPTKPIEP
ncbi:MAG: hypothetical protein ACHQFX_12805 [Chitinophagales bacterium]